MMADIVHRPLEPQHEVSARMYRWKSADLERVEDAKDVELAFLREVGAIGENCKGDMHGGN